MTNEFVCCVTCWAWQPYLPTFLNSLFRTNYQKQSRKENIEIAIVDNTRCDVAMSYPEEDQMDENSPKSLSPISSYEKHLDECMLSSHECMEIFMVVSHCIFCNGAHKSGADGFNGILKIRCKIDYIYIKFNLLQLIFCYNIIHWDL